MESACFGVSLGHNPKVKVPDRVRKYLLGDICVNIPTYGDTHLEVKYRSSTKSYARIVKLASDNSQVTSIRYFKDAILYDDINTFILHGTQYDPRKIKAATTSILTKEIAGWMVHSSILFLRLKGYNKWIIIQKI
jgi:hypothetical protein